MCEHHYFHLMMTFDDWRLILCLWSKRYQMDSEQHEGEFYFLFFVCVKCISCDFLSFLLLSICFTLCLSLSWSFLYVRTFSVFQWQKNNKQSFSDYLLIWYVVYYVLLFGDLCMSTSFGSVEKMLTICRSSFHLAVRRASERTLLS